MNRFVSIAILSLAIALGSGPTQATDTVSPGQLPDALQGMWRNYQPDLGELGRCAVAYDSHTDRDKMVFTCSVRKLTQMVNKLKIETSISLRMRDEEVEIHGKSNCWDIGRR